MKILIFSLLAIGSVACTANTKQEDTGLRSASGQTPSAPVEKDYGDSARKPVLTDSVATDIRH